MIDYRSESRRPRLLDAIPVGRPTTFISPEALSHPVVHSGEVSPLENTSPSRQHASPPELRDIAQGVAATRTGRSSTIMAAGTFVSRILGFVRQWLLVLAIGGFGVADAFNIANTLPNTLYNLLAGGILNAILVPTIVRTLTQSKKNPQAGQDQVNALLTLSAIVLLGLTVVAVALAYPLVLLFGGGLRTELFNLTVIFALWCLPQIFFYGVYALLGQVLNSLSSFGPYMWAPVVNNLVGIAGLGVFLALYGTAPSQNFAVSSWGAGKVALLAGSMTLGIAVQALILLLPLKHLNYHLRANFAWRGLGLRRTGKVAAWAFASLVANAAMNLLITRVGSEANGIGQANGTFYASTAIYNYASLLYMLPVSLVTMSITTALFTSMAYHASKKDFPALSADFIQAVRLSSLFTLLLAGMLVVGALPLSNMIASNLSPDQARAMALVLVVLSLGIPGQTIFVAASRVFYSLEDTRSQFLITLVFPLFTAIFSVVALLWASPQWWLILATAGEPLGLTVAAVLGLLVLRRRGLSPSVGRQLAGHYLRCLAAVTLAGIPTWFLVNWGMEVPGAGAGVAATFFSGLWRSLVVALVMGPLYLLFTWFFGVHELREGLERLWERVRR